MSKCLKWLGLLVLLGTAFPADATEPVGMELLLAVDVSQSMSDEERQLQFAGIASAFRDAGLINAIANLSDGGMAIAVMMWAGTDQQQLILPWRRLRQPDDCLRFADELERASAAPWKGLTYTAVGSALVRAGWELESNRFAGLRRVIDISGDDPGNQGPPPEDARDQLVADGVVINGLPILRDRQEQEDRAALVHYYRDKVIGGPGAFLLAAQSFADFRRSILAKLIREVAGAPSEAPAQAARISPSTGRGDS